MALEIGLTDELTNTQFAPLAVLLDHYQQNQILEPLADVRPGMRKREFCVKDKLIQVLVSILSGCETLSEVNHRLRTETGLATVLGWKRFADQSSLSRTLDALDGVNIDQLRQSANRIWRRFSRYPQHDWRGYLWLDYDLSGLPCGALAQESQKGYFSDKKTVRDASWLG
jgi:hypothetical protein